MQLPPKNYDAMVKRANPPSPVVKDCLWAFFVGGAICLLGEALRQFYLSWYDKDLAGTLTSITLVMLSAITTVPGWIPREEMKSYSRSKSCRPRQDLRFCWYPTVWRMWRNT